MRARLGDHIVIKLRRNFGLHPKVLTTTRSLFYHTAPKGINSTRSYHFDKTKCDTVLEDIAQQLIQKDQKDTVTPFENVMVVAMQHISGTTVDMFRILRRFGLKQAIIGGVTYSMHEPSIAALKKLGYSVVDTPSQLGYGFADACIQQTVAEIWRTALEEMHKRHKQKTVDLVLILDDLGDLIVNTPGCLFNDIPHKPNRIIGIRQASNPMNQYGEGLPFAVIDVDGSYLKTAIEDDWIATVVADKVIQSVKEKVEIQFSKKPIIGIVSNNMIGQSVINKFLAAGYIVLAYDNRNEAKNKKVIWCNDIASLMSNADVIIGCTGTDITKDPSNLFAILNSINPKYLISTSLKDIEFNTLLISIQTQVKQLDQIPEPLQDIEYVNPNNPTNEKIIILKGGFPIHVDHSPSYLPHEKTWPTYAAVMSACFMAINAHQQGLITAPDVLKLDTAAQILILKRYSELNPNEPALQEFNRLTTTVNEFVLARSKGIELKSLEIPVDTAVEPKRLKL